MRELWRKDLGRVKEERYWVSEAGMTGEGVQKEM